MILIGPFLLTTVGCSDDTEPDSFVDDFYFFDAHTHIIASLGGAGTVDYLMDAGILGVALFGGDLATGPLQQQFPNFVYPFTQHTRDVQTSEIVLDSAMLDRFDDRLTTGVVFGIGEISVRHRPFSGSPPAGDENAANHPILLKVYDLAAQHNVPVTLHFEHEFADELKLALEHNRSATIIWAHAGDAPGSLVRDLMKKHPNLHADISTRNPFYVRGIDTEEQSLTNADDTIKDDWKEVFEEFPDRFVFGFDFGTGNRYPLIDDLIEYYTDLLRQLDDATANKIAHENIERLLGLR